MPIIINLSEARTQATSLPLSIPYLTDCPSSALLSSLVFLRSRLGRMHYQKCRERQRQRQRETERERETDRDRERQTDRQRQRDRQRVLSSVDSTAFVSFTESCDLGDDDFFTCSDSRGFTAAPQKSHSSSV